METSLLLLVLSTIMVQVGNSFPTRGSQSGREKYASWDDVNVVAHGLLQLGQGLKEHVDKTKVQMRDVNAKLKVFNITMSELGKAQQQANGPQTQTKEMEERERLVEQLVDEVRAKVEEVKTESQNIAIRMDRLDEKVKGALGEQGKESNYSDNGGVYFIQRILETQNRRIGDLVEKIKQQQDILDKQNLQLQTLQNRVGQKRLKSHGRRDEERALRIDTEQRDMATGLARDCHDLYEQGQRVSGVYTIQPQDSRAFNVLCEMTTEGGWTVIQKRHDGSQNFNQQWERYQKGFGSLNGEFWLGLENIFSLSKQGQYTLRVELTDWAGQEQSAHYQFRLDGEEKNYAIHLEKASTSEVLRDTKASGLPFSTSDRDNDLSTDNCAMLLSGGWWFSNCGESNLNGQYPRRSSIHRRPHPRRQGMFWLKMRGHNNSLKTTVLKISPATVQQ